MESWDELSTRTKVAVTVAGVAAGAALLRSALQPSPPSKAPTIDEGAAHHTPGAKAFWQAESCRDVAQSKEGMGAMEPITLVKVFEDAVAAFGDKPMLKVEDVDPNPPAKGEKAPPSVELGEWKTWTYSQYFADSKKVAGAFMKLGMEKHDAVSVWGFNSVQWHMSAMGAILGGGVIAGIYPSDTQQQVQFKAQHSGAAVMVVQDEKKKDMLMSIATELPKLKAVVVWQPEGELKDKRFGSRTVRCLTWDQLMKEGTEMLAAGGAEELQGVMDAQQPGEACAYIYTSGTTGNPKAVMISHDNIVFEASNAANLIPCISPDGERILSYLPLSHVAGMMVDIVCPLVMRSSYCTVCFARAYDLKIGTIGDRLRAVRPTLFLGVPRVWEKIMEKMQATIAANPPTGLTKVIGKLGKGINLTYQQNAQMGKAGGKSLFHFLGAKVGSKVRGLLGLDACNYAFTGAAPIKVETLEFFGALGININEVYGMSECTGATTWSTDQHHVWGSCGWAVPGTEVTIRDAETGKEVPAGEQGEVCFRGRHIMLGYMANPDLGQQHVDEIKKKNEEAIDKDGWLHSGDKGKVMPNGMCYITGRYKELIIGAGGENVAPVPVEDGIKARCKAISNVMMVGDKRKFNVALVTLKCVGATGDEPGTDQLEAAAQDVDPACKTIADASKPDSGIVKAIEAAIMATNKDPECCPMPPSRIQKFTILPSDFSVRTDELTPTFKLKRSVAEGKHTKFIDTMYDDACKTNYVPYASK